MTDKQVEAYLQENPEQYYKWHSVITGMAKIDANEIAEMTGAELSIVAYVYQKYNERRAESRGV